MNETVHKFIFGPDKDSNNKVYSLYEILKAIRLFDIMERSLMIQKSFPVNHTAPEQNYFYFSAFFYCKLQENVVMYRYRNLYTNYKVCIQI